MQQVSNVNFMKHASYMYMHVTSIKQDSLKNQLKGDTAIMDVSIRCSPQGNNDYNA